LKTEKYKEAIAAILKCNPANIFLYWKGRVALYAILKAMGVKENDEVIIPAFTCVVVPNAILYLGAKPVYVDISAEDYNTDINKLKEAITPKTKVIICQNTFGLSSNVDEIIKLAEKHNLFTIEDCTHGFGGFYNGKPNGSYCDAAFYSTQWNKPYSTGIGGFLVVNNNKLIDNVKILEGEKIKPTFIDNLILALLILFRQYFVNRYTYWAFVGLYRFLSNHNLIIGSTQGDELSVVKMPDKYFKGMSYVQTSIGLRKLGKLEKVNSFRQKNAEDYTYFLKDKKKTFVDKKFFNNHLFLKYPLLVKDRKLFFELAEKEKVILGDWFKTPLYPVKENFELWGFDSCHYPCSTDIAGKIVNLPTDIKNNSKVLRFIEKNLNLVE
jgi:perosamine synthetase